MYDNPSLGYVYVFRMGDIFKIGVTRHYPEIRRRQLSANHKKPIAQIYSSFIPHPRRVEEDWKRRFADKRANLDTQTGYLSHTEWFHLTDEDMAWIYSHPAIHPDEACCGK